MCVRVALFGSPMDHRVHGLGHRVEVGTVDGTLPPLLGHRQAHDVGMSDVGMPTRRLWEHCGRSVDALEHVGEMRTGRDEDGITGRRFEGLRGFAF